MPEKVSIELLTRIVGMRKSAGTAPAGPALSVGQLHDIMRKLAAHEKRAGVNRALTAVGRSAAKARPPAGGGVLGWLKGVFGYGGAQQAGFPAKLSGPRPASVPRPRPTAPPPSGQAQPGFPSPLASGGKSPGQQPGFPAPLTGAAPAGPATAAGAAPAAAAAPSVAARQGMGWKAKLGLGAGIGAGVGGAGAVTGGHLYEQHEYDPESHRYNPFDVFGSKPDKYDMFTKNKDRYNQLAAPLIQEQTEALAAGDTAKAHAIQLKLDQGDFGRGYRALGLNPFVGGPTGQTALKNMQQARGMAQGDYEGAVGRHSTQPGDAASVKMINERLARGDLLPQQAAGLRRQLEFLKQRMTRPAGTEDDQAKMIKSKMLQFGMTDQPQPQQQQQGPPAGVGYPRGMAPPGWGVEQGFNVGINDYRADQDDAVTPRPRDRYFR
jgi:hypothetical protein